jgi:hypothetical protein
VVEDSAIDAMEMTEGELLERLNVSPFTRAKEGDDERG